MQDQKIIITPLKERLTFLDTCAAWSYAEWVCQVPNETYDDLRAKYAARMLSETEPSLWIATIDDKPVGMASLKDQGHEDRSDLTPWLGSIYVHNKYRKAGIGKFLCDFIMNIAKEQGHHKIYLYSSFASDFWQHNGWQQIGHVNDPMDPENPAPLFEKTL